jgi:ADP-heptose:LPS heptosyltransferase
MPTPSKPVKRIALVNFGGIGDEILFSPVIAAIREQFPAAHLTLFLEGRSRSVSDLLPGLDAVETVTLQGVSRTQLFGELIRRLRGKGFDWVVCSGSSPFISVMLFLTGIPFRVGFDSGPVSRLLLSAAAPLNKQIYAAEMYFSLARTALVRWTGNGAAGSETPPIPSVRRPESDRQAWADDLLGGGTGRRVLIHPGASKVSVEKGIFKGWSAERWAELITQLATASHRVFLVGGPDDQAIVEAIQGQLPDALSGFTNLYGQTRNLQDLAALVQQADVLVSVDSSPLHIAVGLGKPVVVLFGPTDEKKLIPPDRDWVQAVTLPDLSCRPCLWDVRQANCESSTCLDVPVSAMLQTIDRVLGTATVIS